MSFDTRRGLILAALMTRVRVIQTASGYHFDVKAESVVSDPVNVITVPEPSLPFVMVEVSGGTRGFQPANRALIETRFVLTGCLMANGTSATRKVEAGEAFVGDLEKAIAGPGADITLGGLVIDARVQEPDGPMVGLGSNNRVFTLMEVVTTHIREHGLP